LVTIAASAYMILYNHQLYALVRRAGLLRMFRAPEEPQLIRTESDLNGHVIVVGMNSLGRRLVHELAARGEQVLAVDVSPARLVDLPATTLMGNAEDLALLQTAALPKAKLLVSALQIEEANTLLAYWGRSFGVPTSIHAFDQSIFDELREAGAGHLIVSKSSGTRRTARALREMGLFG
jgi:Trk K+ transport system NAD-binding subunit